MDELAKKAHETDEQHAERVLSVIDEQMWKDFAGRCIPRLREIIDSSENDPTVLKAIELVLNRAYGKSKESIDVTSGGEMLAAPIIQYIQPKKDT